MVVAAHDRLDNW